MRLDHNFFALPENLDELLLRIVQAIWITAVLSWFVVAW